MAIALLVDASGSIDSWVSDNRRERPGGATPERYTRVGAALRHVTAMLMREPARHRLLLLLSDGKPNDVDQ